MHRSFLLIVSLFQAIFLFGQNQVPTISNLHITRTASDQLTIEYDLEDAENDDIEISLRVSSNGGETYSVNTATAVGDLGFPVAPGPGKTIYWDFESAINSSGNYTVMLVANDRQAVDIQTIVDQVDSTRLRQDLERIEGVRHRTAGRDQLQRVKDLIVERCEDHGLQTEITAWVRGNYTAENIIGRKAGLTDETEIYIIDGHFDTVEESPGADDNGSAVAGVLEAMRVLSPYQFEKTIKFIGFDLEEEGLIGSQYYTNVEGLKPYEEVGGVFNFEMIGYYDNSPNSQQFPTGFDILYPDVYSTIMADSFRGNFITNVGIYNHPELNEAYANAAARYVPELKVASILAPESWLLLTPDLGRSDHAPFWLQGMPALMLTDGSNFRNPYYHSPNDTVGTLNFTFMSNVVKAAVGAVAELAGVTHSSFATGEIEILTNATDLESCHIDIFPNPNSEVLHLNFNNCQFQDGKIEIYDVSGNLVFDRKVEPDVSHLSIPTSKWAPGTYLMTWREAQEVYQKKIVVSR